MISIAWVVLSDGLTLPDEFENNGIVLSDRPTLGGGAVIQYAANNITRFSLTARRDGDALLGYFTRLQVQQLRVLRDLMQPVRFVHHLGSWDVKILEIKVEPSKDVSEPKAGHLYIGTISMIEV